MSKRFVQREPEGFFLPSNEPSHGHWVQRSTDEHEVWFNCEFGSGLCGIPKDATCKEIGAWMETHEGQPLDLSWLEGYRAAKSDTTVIGDIIDKAREFGARIRGLMDADAETYTAARREYRAWRRSVDSKYDRVLNDAYFDEFRSEG